MQLVCSKTYRHVFLDGNFSFASSLTLKFAKSDENGTDIYVD
jgi:hypothetical protein